MNDLVITALASAVSLLLGVLGALLMHGLHRRDDTAERASSRQGDIVAELSGINTKLDAMRADIQRIEDTRATKESVDHLAKLLANHEATLAELTRTAAPIGERLETLLWKLAPLALMAMERLWSARRPAGAVP